jgi:hypothetical protein
MTIIWKVWKVYENVEEESGYLRQVVILMDVWEESDTADLENEKSKTGNVWKGNKEVVYDERSVKDESGLIEEMLI